MKKLAFMLGLIYIGIVNIIAQGLVLSTKEQLNDVDTWVNDNHSFIEKLPDSYSLEKFCPVPLSQGNDGTCVGYAVCYSAISIMYNIQMNITDPFEKYALSFDPYFMYSALRMNMDVDCQEGLNMGTALNFLYEKGIKRWAMMPYLDCSYEWKSDEWKFVQNYAQPFSIVNYQKVESMDDVKMLISNKLPVLIGVSIDGSIYSNTDMGGTVGSDGLWTPNPNKKKLGGHSLTVIGYDNKKFGGAFRIMNSWGNKYGDGGFIWIKYSDFAKAVKEAWVILPKFLKADKIEETINTKYYSRFYFDNGDVYEGMYKDDNFDGIGFYQWKGGDIYFGIWENDKRNGYGIFFDYSEKDYKVVYYENGVYVPDQGIGFSDDGKPLQLDTYLEKFKIGIKKVEAGREFDMPEMGSIKIIKK